MNVTKNYPFTDSSKYAFDSSKISISGGNASLVLQNNTGQTYNQPFTSSTGFSFDSSKSEFSGGVVRQIDQRPTNALSYATYTTDINLNDGAGTLTGTATGGASVVSNKLDLSGGTIKYVDYDFTNNGNEMVQTGAIKFKYTPKTTGNPAANTTPFSISNADSDPTNRIEMFYSAGWRFSVYDSLKTMVGLSVG